MKSIYSVVIVFIVASLFCTTCFAQQNLFSNQGFENGQISPFDQGVVRGNLTIETNPAHVRSGSKSLRHQSTGGDSYTLPWNGRLIASYSGAQTYRLTAWVKANTVNTAVQMFIFNLDQNYGSTPASRTTATYNIGTNWQKITLTFNCAANRKFVNVRLDLNTSSRTVWWDDLSLENITSGAEALKLDFIPSGTNDQNFRLSGVGSFSVARAQNGEYRLYGGASQGGAKWNNSLNNIESVFFQTNPNVCSFNVDPRYWDTRCIEHIGLFTKDVACTGNNACQSNDLWNAYPGNRNVSTFTRPSLWPKTNDYGTNGYVDLLGKEEVHNVNFQGGGQGCEDGDWCPPKTGFASSCYPVNPDDYATGVSNSKVVEVIYPNGQKRWFMAFNIQLRNMVHPDGKLNSDDIWQAAWAWSNNGTNWNIYNRFLFRNVKDASLNVCASGFLLNNLFVENGYFYLLFTKVHSKDIFMARSRISDTPPSNVGTPGFHLNNLPRWEIASGLDFNGNYLWNSIDGHNAININTIYAIGGRNIFPVNLNSEDRCLIIRQADVTKVYLDDSPQSPYRYIAVATEKSRFNNSCNTEQGQKLYLYATPDLSKGFRVESEIDISHIPVGAFGQEISFTQDSHRRTLADQIDLWMTENLSNPLYPLDPLATLTSSRKTMKLTGQIFSNGSGATIQDITAPRLNIDGPANGQTVNGNVLVNGWALDANTVDNLELRVDGILQNGSFQRTNKANICNNTVNLEIGGDPDCPMIGWQTVLNTSGFSNGQHTIEVTAYDPSGNHTSKTTNVVFSNAVDNVIPKMWIDAPTNNQRVTGNLQLRGWAIDANTVSLLELRIDNVLQNQTFIRTYRADVCNHPVNVGVNDPDCPQVGWQTTLNTLLLSNGMHSLKVTAYDPSGNQKSISRNIEVRNALMARYSKNKHAPMRDVPNNIVQSIQVSPNPFKEIFNVQFQLQTTQEASLVIQTVEGRILKSVHLQQLSAGPHTLSIDSADYPPGIYFVTLNVAGRLHTQKIIKMNQFFNH